MAKMSTKEAAAKKASAAHARLQSALDRYNEVKSSQAWHQVYLALTNQA